MTPSYPGIRRIPKALKLSTAYDTLIAAPVIARIVSYRMRLRLLCMESTICLGKGSSNLWVHSLKSLGKGSFGQRLLQIIIRLNTLVDVIRVPKVRTSGE